MSSTKAKAIEIATHPHCITIKIKIETYIIIYALTVIFRVKLADTTI
jgi:hypothetical protein